MRSEKGIAQPLIILIVALVIGAIGFVVYKNTATTSDEMIPSPTPMVEATMAPTASASATVAPTAKPTIKPTVKPTVKPTPTSTVAPTPAPTQEASNNNSGGDCGGKSVSISINADGGVVGDTLVRITGRSDSEGCGFGTSKEEIMRNGQSSISIGGLTPATYNLFITYHGKQYNEEFTIKKGEDASKSVSVTN